MSPSTVKMICPENEDKVSIGIEYDDYHDVVALEKEVDYHEDIK